ncbi:MAG: PAS domain-containing sensor histidine kinase [Deltaproteobacteria bacterium]|nr:PAS domain-containing sensor histidine kinase [Deltaproteobacteria bacterium]
MAEFPAFSHFQSFLEAFVDPVWVVNRALRLVYLNPAAAVRFSRSRDQVVGRVCHQVLFENHEPCPFCEVDQVFASGSRRRRNFTLLDNDGKNHVYALDCYPCKGPGGAVEYVLSVCVDKTEGADLFAEISRLKGLAEMGEYSAELSHEIRNPLNSIEIQMSLLQRLLSRLEPDAAEPFRRVIEVVRTENTRLSSLAADFLQIKKNRRLALEVCEAGALLGRLLELFAGEAEARGVAVRLGPVAAGCFLRADVDKLQQAFVNLLKNALEAMTEARIPAPEISLAVEPGRENLVFSFADNGPGIPFASQPKIFDLFYTTKGCGSGIGLHLCREIIRAHDGDMSFVSDSRGTVFRVTLPRLTVDV